jgi:hypothetical protein
MYKEHDLPARTYCRQLKVLEQVIGGTATYIRGIGDKFPKKDLLVAVESVDDEAQQLINLSLESESLHFASLRLFHYHFTSLLLLLLLLLLVLRDDRHHVPKTLKGTTTQQPK